MKTFRSYYTKSFKLYPPPTTKKNHYSFLTKFLIHPAVKCQGSFVTGEFQNVFLSAKTRLLRRLHEYEPLLSTSLLQMHCHVFLSWLKTSISKLCVTFRDLPYTTCIGSVTLNIILRIIHALLTAYHSRFNYSVIVNFGRRNNSNTKYVTEDESRVELVAAILRNNGLQCKPSMR